MKQKHFLITLCVFLIFIFFISSVNVRRQAYFHPDYQKIDLMPILTKNTLSEGDYQILYEQTGIAKPIIDELKNTSEFKDRIISFQNDFFSAPKVYPEALTLVTKQDYIKNSNQEIIPGFELAPYQNGYIFLTKSTYTMNWRHGHAGIVVDAKRGKILESLHPGTTSIIQDVNNWRYYPTFKMMRPKNISNQDLDAIALYAASTLKGLPYNILSMKDQSDIPYETHCSLLVWQTYKAFGFDLDATGGLLVSPWDIAKSPLLETLQIFGLDPRKE